jgi:hypothetical protein
LVELPGIRLDFPVVDFERHEEIVVETGRLVL